MRVQRAGNLTASTEEIVSEYNIYNTVCWEKHRRSEEKQEGTKGTWESEGPKTKNVTAGKNTDEGKRMDKAREK